MLQPDYPSEGEIRAALIRRADEFTRLTGLPKSVVGKEAVNDPAFLSQVAGGRNFTVGLYRRVMDWLDENWPKDGDPKAKAPERAAS